MKKVLFFLLILFTIFAVDGPAKKFINTPFLEKVEREPAVEKDVVLEKNGTYKDQLIHIVWSPSPRGFDFVLINQSTAPIKVIWKQCYLKDAFSKYTIVHGGIKGIEQQPASSISPKKKLSDHIYPAAFVKYVRGRYTEIRQKTIYKKKFKEKDAPFFSATTFTATLTLLTGDTLYKYLFHFKTELVEH
ncbi:MAG: hypothetical protein GY765_30630 [bacterium]|nr:hypothetical protein [bacterium]